MPLGYNLDMNFVLVPPTQPRVPVRITEYPQESDPGPFPVPENAPIENWPLAHNEDHGALPGPQTTLGEFQRHGTGDRHLIIVDPANKRLHEFWQARLTDQGWQASQASTFDSARTPCGPTDGHRQTRPASRSFRPSFATTKSPGDGSITRCV